MGMARLSPLFVSSAAPGGMPDFVSSCMGPCCVAMPCCLGFRPYLIQPVEAAVPVPRDAKPARPSNSLDGRIPAEMEVAMREYRRPVQLFALPICGAVVRPGFRSSVDPRGTPDAPEAPFPVTSVPPKGRITGLSPAIGSSVLPSGMLVGPTRPNPDCIGLFDASPGAALKFGGASGAPACARATLQVRDAMSSAKRVSFNARWAARRSRTQSFSRMSAVMAETGFQNGRNIVFASGSPARAEAVVQLSFFD
jgi:hypothetical protein